jgi:hypothetical protein
MSYTIEIRIRDNRTHLESTITLPDLSEEELKELTLPIGEALAMEFFLSKSTNVRPV